MVENQTDLVERRVVYCQTLLHAVRKLNEELEEFEYWRPITSRDIQRSTTLGCLGDDAVIKPRSAHKYLLFKGFNL